MRTYLVDFENVHSQGLIGVRNLPETDEVVVFYTESANSMTVDLHNELMNTKANVIFKKVTNGIPNALDFQLSSYLGYVLANNPNTECVIVAKDTGYSVVIKFWKDKFKIVQVNQICALLSKQDTTKDEIKLIETKPVVISEPKAQIKDSVTVERKDLESALKDIEVNIDWLMEIIDKYKMKVNINNAIVKEYKQEKAKVIYKAIKPLLKNKN